MDKALIREFSYQLKDIAKDLSFLGHPRYPLKDLLNLFPQHKEFISELEDVSVPFPVNVSEKRKAMDTFLRRLAPADVPLHLKRIFTQRIHDYHLLLSMMENFDNVFFYEHCTKLYGSSHKMGKNNAFLYFLEKIPEFCLPDTSEKSLQGEAAMDYLRVKMAETFDPKDFEVKPSASLLSDSSAGRRTLKLNPFKTYTTGHLDIFLVHEGWVHLGTSLNGAAQEDHPWLSTWAPRTTFLQEGLAIITELITGCMTRERWNKVVLRHLATSMAERGSPITDVYQYLRHHQMADLDAFKLSLRVFRGVPFEGGMAFTKELLYLHGMIELLYHMHFFKTDLRSLWVGKMSFEEHLMVVDNWKTFNPELKYFPKALDNPVVLERLQKLKELSFSLFHHGFL
ncbi:MAG TPA: tyrosine/phenylalanine carboxypeptidase domain-containing protein [Bacteriovoracaceae bacterium]|nr:tyrosine/phenylalanine carboxypeptidase domain-containing protein [Bacteriovoracaceae bacterium]